MQSQDQKEDIEELLFAYQGALTATMTFVTFLTDNRHGLISAKAPICTSFVANRSR